jgi:hypothetical protein
MKILDLSFLLLILGDLLVKDAIEKLEVTELQRSSNCRNVNVKWNFSYIQSC